jgi:hypothetical protein
MIKNYLLIVAFFFAAIQAKSQCTPNAYSGNHGFITPDSSSFPHAIQGQPFHAVINIQVAQDTVGLFPLGATSVQGTYAFDSVTIYSVATIPVLPAGVTMTYTCSPSNCKFLGANTGCIDLDVSPIATPGVYRIYVNAVAKGTFTPTLVPFPLTNQSISQVVDRYKIVVDDSTTFITEYEGDLNKFEIISIQNNTANQTANIKYFAPTTKPLSINVFDVCGKQIFADKLMPKAGDNMLDLNTARFGNGIYFVTINDSKSKTSKKFIIQQ